MNRLWQRKILKPVTGLLKQGLSHEKIALSVAMGVTIGIFPVLGATTGLCAIAAFALRLSLPAIQLVNFMIYPLQLLLFIPFLRAGGWLFGGHRFLHVGKEIFSQFQNDIWGSLAGFWNLTLYAILTWLIISPLLVLVLYEVLKPALKRLPLEKVSPEKNSAKDKAKMMRYQNGIESN
jgi:hypothetical protein